VFIPFVLFFVSTLAFLPTKGGGSRKAWILVIVLACILSLLLAYVSVMSVWTPNPTQVDIFKEQNALGEYEGVFPWAKLSYPCYLNVYHTPGRLLQFNTTTGINQGQAHFNIFFANAKTITFNGTYWYYFMYLGPMPFHYKIDFIFSDSETFYDFLIVLFTLFNVIGALFGILMGTALRVKISRTHK
jgi:hypothetical protein